MGNTLNTITIAIGKALSSLEQVLESSSKAKVLINTLGWELPPGVEDIGLASVDLTDFLEKLRIVTESSGQEWENEPLMAGRIADLGLSLHNLVGEISHLAKELPDQLNEYGDYVSRTNIHKELLKRISDLMVTGYVSNKSKLVFSILRLLNIVEFRPFEADPENYQLQHVRTIVHYNHFHSLFSDPSGHLKETYGWSTPEFSSLDLFTRIGEVLRALGATVRMQPMDPRAENALVGDLPYDTTNNPAPQMIIQLYEDLGEIAGLMLGFTVFGVRPTLEGASDGGIGFLPIVRGQVEGEIPLYAFDDTVFEFSADADLLKRMALILRPNLPLQVQKATNLGDLADGRFALGIRHGKADEPKTLVSFPGGSRLTMEQFTLIGGLDKASEEAMESFMELGIWGGQFILSMSEADGFLSKTISIEEIQVPFGFRVGWNSRKGIYFLGGAGLSVTIPLDRNLGPIFLQLLHLSLDINEEGFDVEVSISGNLTLGPLAITVGHLGTDVEVSFTEGNLGLMNLSPRFQPPTAIGLSIDAEGITGGGFLEIDPPNYSGMIQLSFNNEIELTAFGLITTRLPDGKDGFSMIVQIMAEFQPIQVGLGFALTGVGGLIGINRQINEEGLKEAFKNHSLDTFLFPENPIKDAVKLIESIQTIMPPREGYHIIGPMVQMFWGGSVKLVEFEIGIFIQTGGPLKVVILGQARTRLPEGDSPRLVINMDVLGIIDFGEERVAIDAVLFNSRILNFTLDGKMALRSDWSSGEESFALSAGGFNPRFQNIPTGFPQLTRLMVNFGSGNPRLTLQMYLAITPNTLQIGAKFDLWAKKSGFTVTGGTSFDALFTFSPFSFLVVVLIWVNIKRSRINLSAELELELSGPNPMVAVGYAKFKVGWFSKKVRFRKQFGNKNPESLPLVSPVAALLVELEQTRSIQFELPAWASTSLVFTETAELKIDPVADIVISQNAVPLNFNMERFGGGLPPEAEQELSITAGLEADKETVTTTLFAPEQFKNWSVDERLSARPFEKYDAGIRFSGEYIIPEAAVEERRVEFETVLRESKSYRQKQPKDSLKRAKVRTTCVWRPTVIEAQYFVNWSLFGSKNYFKPLRKVKNENRTDYIKVIEPGFILAGNHGQDEGLSSSAIDGQSNGAMSYAEAMDAQKRTTDTSSIIRSAADVVLQ